MSTEKLAQALRYYRDECTGAEPSLSVFERMLDEAMAEHEAQVVSVDQACDNLLERVAAYGEACGHGDASECATTMERVESAIQAVIAAAAPQPLAGAVPQGWRLVPEEPTISMLMAGHMPRISEEHPTSHHAVWAAMLAAAPQPQAREPLPYLVNGARYKVTADSRQSDARIYGLPRELNGRWVALVAAEDNQHMQARKPLTRDQVKALVKEAGYEGAAAQHRADFINGLRHGERAHGIA